MPNRALSLILLCKVVDNYGDIGVAYRLARDLSDRDPRLSLSIITDDLAAFSRIEPGIDPGAAFQIVRGWKVMRWDAPSDVFSRKALPLVIECFACGRPDWLEDLLFDPLDAGTKHIVNLEYLTAEAYAQEMHRTLSITRSSCVKKWFFMPGFTERTGGLILDDAFMRAFMRYGNPSSREAARAGLARSLGLEAAATRPIPLWISIFSYERDYSQIVADIGEFSRERPVFVLAANGKSQSCFLSAWGSAGRPFPAVALPFLPQEIWDEVILASDFSIVRGEDSLSRAALAGHPFLWHIYPQDGKHHLVKLKAFLERLRPCFPADAFEAVAGLYLAFNDRERDTPKTDGPESILPVLRNSAGIKTGFHEFSESLAALGDLGAALLTFLREIV